MRVIERQNFPSERDLYAAENVWLKNCTFAGPEDGESALKEARNVKLEGCFMDLRYPLWHNAGVGLVDVTMSDKCRAAVWYTDGLTAHACKLLGIKALRECVHIDISDSEIVSPEFGWKCRDVRMRNCAIESEYCFLLSADVRLESVKFRGKYSFQYVENATLENCMLETKDAFWHSKNVTVRDSVVKGEYLGWYSENLTLIGCKIIGTQPLCYCKGLRLVDCEMLDADLSFEYSEVDATILGEILSVKNPRAGRIVCDRVGELVYTPDSRYVCTCEIVQNAAEKS